MRRVEEEAILTEEGYKKILEELKYLKEVKRKEVAEKIQEARALGDLSENSEFEAAKEEQALLEERIARLETLVYNARVVKAEDLALDQVSVGTKVLVLDESTGREEGRFPPLWVADFLDAKEATVLKLSFVMEARQFMKSWT